MTDKIQKILAKLTAKERDTVKLLVLRIKLDDTDGLDIKHLAGHKDLFRVRKGRLRILYEKNSKQFMIRKIDRRNESTYKDL